MLNDVLDNRVTATNNREMSTGSAVPASLHRVSDVESLEAIIGRTPDMVMMKQLDALDDGCRRLLAASPIAGVGFRDLEGRPHTTLVGGVAGFVQVDSPQRISFDLPVDGPFPADRSGVSFVFLLPGIGETLRLNGSAAARSGRRLAVNVEEAYIHCARCVLRSDLWEDPQPGSTAQPVDGNGPLADPKVAEFLASAPFLVLSSQNAGGASDTSPRGDQRGFARILDDRTVAVPDRRGNQRADTFRNLLSDPRISAGVLVPGRADILHLSGTAFLTDDPALLARLAVGGTVPHAALIINVEQASLRTSETLRTARVWDHSAHVNGAAIPDMMVLAAKHLSTNRSGGTKAKATRLAVTPLGAFPDLARRLIDFGYRRQLRSEGYAVAPQKPLRHCSVRLVGRLPHGLRRTLQRLCRDVSSSFARWADTIEGTLAPDDRRAPREVRVVEVLHETADAVTLTLEDVSGALFEFRPGQFFTLIVQIDGRSVRRPYSASSVPRTARLTLTIKRIAGGRCSVYLNDTARADDRLRLLGPSGSFGVEDPATAGPELVLIAGGSGITPLMSIIRAVLAANAESRLTLLYGDRSDHRRRPPKYDGRTRARASRHGRRRSRPIATRSGPVQRPADAVLLHRWDLRRMSGETCQG